jgi:hypothetical protein
MKKLILGIIMISLFSCTDNKEMYPEDYIAGSYKCNLIDLKTGNPTDTYTIQLSKTADHGFVNFVFKLNNNISVKCIVTGTNPNFILNVMYDQTIYLDDGTGTFYKAQIVRYIESQDDGGINLINKSINLVFKISCPTLGYNETFKFIGYQI